MLTKFDFDLPKAAILYVEEIEDTFKSSIVFISAPDMAAHAACTINDDRIPEIHVKRGTPYDIVHEIAHLRCRARGYPSTATRRHPTNPMTSMACSEVQAIVEHQVIYPELIEMGFDPHEDVRSSIANARMTAFEPLPNIPGIIKAIYYLRSDLESNSPEIMAAIDRRYSKYGPAFRSTARKMKFQILNAGFSSVEANRAAMVNALGVVDVLESRDYEVIWD